jgi:Raf kinase inhibitor-like YbhB/YbcL family protein
MLELRSPAFGPWEELPQRFTCEGDDHSPPLEWRGVPSGSRSLALLVEDPDAGEGWTHWVLYDLPVTQSSLLENLRPVELPLGTHVGVNSWGRAQWGGPCPPAGRHRYRFTLYALDVSLGQLDPPTAAGLRDAMGAHVLEEAVLIATYQRKLGAEK